MLLAADEGENVSILEPDRDIRSGAGVK